MGIITKRYVGSQVVAIICIFLFVKSPDDLLLVAIFELVAAAIALVWSWVNVLRQRRIYFTRVRLQRLWPIWNASTVFFLSNAATTAFTAFTTLMIGVQIDDVQQISYWSLAMTAVAAIQSLYSPISNSLYPRICIAKDASLAKTALKVGTPLVLVVAILFGLFSNEIMLIIGGAEYVRGSYILPLVAPVLVFSYAGIIIGFPVLAAFGRSKSLTQSSVVAACFHILMLLVFAALGLFTIESVAVLRCLTECIMMVARIAFSRDILRTC